MIEFPNDPFNVVALWTHIEAHFMPPENSDFEVGRFFRRHAYKKDITVSFRLLYTYLSIVIFTNIRILLEA